MSSYILAPRARIDIYEIWRYIVEHDSLNAAERVETEIRSAIEKVAEAPWIGHKHSESPDERLRFWVVHSWLIVYLPETKPVQIVRVLHGAREVGERLGSA